MASRSDPRAVAEAAPTIEALLAAAAGAPLDSAAAAALGLRALDERREEDALPHVARAAAAAPADVRLHHILGLLHRELGDLAPALAAFDVALARAPQVANLVHARARAAFEAGLPSLDWYARARMLAPKDGDVILGEAAALTTERSSAEADGLLAAMLRQHPGWIAGHAALLRLRFASGTGPFLGELDRALAGAPGDPRLLHLRIMALHRAGDAEGAIAAAAAGVAVADAVPELRAAQAIVATEHQDVAHANLAFARVDPSSEPDLFIHWLRHLLRRGEPERVSALAATALPPPLAAVTWPYLSIAWRLLGDVRAAWLDDPRLVKIIDFGENWPVLPRLGETLRGMHRHRSQPLDQSVRGGTQTDGQLLLQLNPALAGLRAQVAAEIAAYSAALPARDAAHPLLGRVPRHPRFVGSWSVRLTGGGFHDQHIHNMGWLSSVLYVALPSAGRHAGELVLGEPQRSLGLDLPPLRVIEPALGRLVLFPSTLWHGTRPFAAGERLTVAFDVS